jgi:hypothetical protein
LRTKHIQPCAGCGPCYSFIAVLWPGNHSFWLTNAHDRINHPPGRETFVASFCVFALQALRSMEGPIPDSVTRLIAVHIRTLEQLEILLLLAGQPTQRWNVDGVYNVVRSSRSSVAERLEELRTQGLIAFADAEKRDFRFQPQSPEIADAVKLLAECYRERRVKIVEMIYSPPAEPLKGFADAFKFKKEKQ